MCIESTQPKMKSQHGCVAGNMNVGQGHGGDGTWQLRPGSRVFMGHSQWVSMAELNLGLDRLHLYHKTHLKYSWCSLKLELSTELVYPWYRHVWHCPHRFREYQRWRVRRHFELTPSGRAQIQQIYQCAMNLVRCWWLPIWRTTNGQSPSICDVWWYGIT